MHMHIMARCVMAGLATEFMAGDGLACVRFGRSRRHMGRSFYQRFPGLSSSTCKWGQSRRISRSRCCRYPLAVIGCG